MFEHLVIIFTKDSKRIGFHHSKDFIVTDSDREMIVSVMNYLESNEVDASVHTLMIEGQSIKDLINHDSYFKGVEFYKDADEFINAIEGRTL